MSRRRCVGRCDQLDGDTAAVSSYSARFVGVVFPSETLNARVWKEDGRFVANVVAPSRDDAAVLSDVELTPA
jgi:hypothetical protein